MTEDLFGALARNNIDAARSLLEQGCDPDIRDRGARNRGGRTPLMYAALEGNEQFVSLLIAHGADVNAQDTGGFSPLHFAAQDYRVAAAEALLRSGATVDLQNRYGNTPLSQATFSSRGRGEMIRLLLRYGANPQLKNRSDVSPIDLAKNIGNYNVKQFFEGEETS